MEPMLQWGLDFIRSVQSCASPALTIVMRIITNLGSASTYLIALPFIYWCVDEKKGMRLSITVLISVWINLALKFLFNQPRPFFEGYDPLVGMINERLGGLPSGHAQNSVVLLIIIASWLKRKWAFCAAALLCLLIGFSRIYLGVHFPTDVLCGWLLGALVLCGYFLLSNRIEALIAKGGFRTGMIASAILSLVMIFYLPSEELLLPGGVMLGMGAGYCLNRRYIGFSSAVSDKTGLAGYLVPAARYLLGIGSLVLLFILLEPIGKIIPRDSGNYNLYAFARFALAGLWICVGVPFIYIKLRLAAKQKEQ